jgi:hypothetical protein
MPDAVMVIVGEPGAGEGDGVVTGGVGDVGTAVDAPLEHAAVNRMALRAKFTRTVSTACLVEAIQSASAKADRWRNRTRVRQY